MNCRKKRLFKQSHTQNLKQSNKILTNFIDVEFCLHIFALSILFYMIFLENKKRNLFLLNEKNGFFFKSQ